MLSICEENAEYLVTMNTKNLPLEKVYGLEACMQLKHEVLGDLVSRGLKLSVDMVYNLGIKSNQNGECYDKLLIFLLKELLKKNIRIDLSKIYINSYSPFLVQYVDINGRDLLFILARDNNHRYDNNLFLDRIGLFISLGANIYLLDKDEKSFLDFIPPYLKFCDISYHIATQIENIFYLLHGHSHYGFFDEIYSVADVKIKNIIYETIREYPHTGYGVMLDKNHKEDFESKYKFTKGKDILNIFILNEMNISESQFEYIIYQGNYDLDKLLKCLDINTCEKIYESLDKPRYFMNNDIHKALIIKLFNSCNYKYIDEYLSYGLDTDIQTLSENRIGDSIQHLVNIKVFCKMLILGCTPKLDQFMRDKHEKMEYLLKTSYHKKYDEKEILICSSYSLKLFLKFIAEGLDYRKLKDYNFKDIKLSGDIEKFLEINLK